MKDREIEFLGHKDFPTVLSIENITKLNDYVDAVVDWAKKDINPDTINAVSGLIESLRLD